jgi:hypothetical protein
MRRCRAVAPTVIAAAMLALPARGQAQDAEPRLPVSLTRIRAALQEPPPRLRVPAWTGEVPTFRVEIHQDFFHPQPLEDEPLSDPTLGLPSVGELLIGGLGKIRSAARGRAKRRAKQEVADALAAFCAVHPCPAPDRK